MVEGGPQRHFPLAVFQFLPAFLTTALRRAARAAYQPLHYLTWSFHLTHLPPEPLPDLPAIESSDPPPSESSADQSADSPPEPEPSNHPAEPSCDPAPDTPCEDPVDLPDGEPTQQTDSPVDPTPATPVPQESPSQGTVDEDPEGEEVEECLQNKEEEGEHGWSCWGQDGNITLFASGLWLVGASWNAERCVLL